jgi:hypothetical protein
MKTKMTPEESLRNKGLTEKEIEGWKVAEDKITYLHSIPAYLADYKNEVMKSNAKAISRRNAADKARAKRMKESNGSDFDYTIAGGMYIPTVVQFNFAMQAKDLTPEQSEACNLVIQGYNGGEKVHHDYIHIVNELIRNYK